MPSPTPEELTKKAIEDAAVANAIQQNAAASAATALDAAALANAQNIAVQQASKDAAYQLALEEANNLTKKFTIDDVNKIFDDPKNHAEELELLSTQLKTELSQSNSQQAPQASAANANDAIAPAVFEALEKRVGSTISTFLNDNTSGSSEQKLDMLNQRFENAIKQLDTIDNPQIQQHLMAALEQGLNAAKEHCEEKMGKGEMDQKDERYEKIKDLKSQLTPKQEEKNQNRSATQPKDLKDVESNSKKELDKKEENAQEKKKEKEEQKQSPTTPHPNAAPKK